MLRFVKQLINDWEGYKAMAGTDLLKQISLEATWYCFRGGNCQVLKYYDI